MKGDVRMPPVEPDEWLSRYILQKSHVRQDNTLRADPFIPHPHADLSVTRHLELDENTLWDVGEHVAKRPNRPARHYAGGPRTKPGPVRVRIFRSSLLRCPETATTPTSPVDPPISLHRRSLHWSSRQGRAMFHGLRED
jgi:hypothetical protein